MIILLGATLLAAHVAIAWALFRTRGTLGRIAALAAISLWVLPTVSLYFNQLVLTFATSMGDSLAATLLGSGRAFLLIMQLGVNVVLILAIVRRIKGRLATGKRESEKDV